jgi:hypothetical protein
MRPEEREHMYRLCQLIEKEQNPERFTALIKELNDLLERKEHRLENRPTENRPNENRPKEGRTSDDGSSDGRLSHQPKTIKSDLQP